MALDRFIYWNTDERPTQLDIQHICEDFLNGIGLVTWHKDRFICDITGPAQTCFNRVRPMWKRDVGLHPDKLRVIEVWQNNDPGEECVDVITRGADELTNSIAAGLAGVIAQAWDGRIEK